MAGFGTFVASLFAAASLHTFIASYGYIAILILMTLEAASLPIPSEIVLPLAGYFIAQGVLNAFGVFAVAIVAGIIGMFIDYFIAYYIGKDIVYKHLAFFHVKRSSLEAFDAWFQRNGAFAVFAMRMVPVLRGLISFPAGFAKMPKKKFFAYSVLGSVIWYAVLIGFGYFALSSSDLSVAVGLSAALGIALYVMYLLINKRIGRRQNK